MIAYCGLKCEICPIYLATRENDPEKQRKMKEEIVREIRKAYGVPCEIEDVTDCDGCHIEDGRLFKGCQQCKIRACDREKGMENCAYCSEYPCIRLREFFDFGGKLVRNNAREQLDAIRKSLGKGI